MNSLEKISIGILDLILLPHVLKEFKDLLWKTPSKFYLKNLIL